MRRPAKPITDEDAALFREAIGAVKALPATSPLPAAPKPKPRARQRERDETEALRSSQADPFFSADEGVSSGVGDSLQYRRDGISERIFRKLRRGQFAVQDEIDLHQLTAAHAENFLREFLIDCRANHHLCVRVIHGKGLHSKSGTAVLKNLVEGILRRRSDVLAYASAPPAMGGTGALLVLLSRRRGNEQGPLSAP